MAFSISSIYEGASFKSEPFLELFDGGFGQPAPAGGVEITTYHLPGSDNNIVMISGRGARKTEIAVGATSDDMDDLEDVIGDSGTLIYSAGTFTARLLNVRDRRAGAPAAGGERATLEFLIV